MCFHCFSLITVGGHVFYQHTAVYIHRVEIRQHYRMEMGSKYFLYQHRLLVEQSNIM